MSDTWLRVWMTVMVLIGASTIGWAIVADRKQEPLRARCCAAGGQWIDARNLSGCVKMIEVQP